MKIALLIPIYKPNDRVLPFLESMKAGDFFLFVVVDDGSGEEYAPIFEKISEMPSFRVISYEKNGGKGHALKEGYSFILKEHPEVEGIVTADGDGQHRYEGILKVRDALSENPGSLVMGVRDFKAPGILKHNKFGNSFSRLYFKLSTHVTLSDTQTGLRGIPSNLFPLGLETPGSRYDYEMNFLTDAVKEAPLVQVSIATIYDDNKDSHFRPLVDSLIIYRTPIIYVLVALLSFGIDEGLFYLFATVLSSELVYKVLIATVSARLISGAFNFFGNYFLVFRRNGGFLKKLGKYSVLFFVNTGLSFALVYAFSYLPSSLSVIKIVVDAILFVVNYFFQLGWVFARKKASKKKKGGAAK